MGCEHCYAAALSKRLQGMGNAKYARGFEVTLHEDEFEIPLHWRKPRTIFVNSMSDTFHADVPLEFIQRMFGIMKRAHWHQFQVLTKRAERLGALAAELVWAPNIWMGVTVEHAVYLDRIEYLRGTDAAVKFLSLEPLLGPLPEIDLTGIDWVVVAGESGPGARPLDPAWVREIRDHCISQDVAFFFKQWGGRRHKSDKLLDGRLWNQMPSRQPATLQFTYGKEMS
jgi:protein gp37